MNTADLMEALGAAEENDIEASAGELPAAASPRKPWLRWERNMEKSWPRVWMEAGLMSMKMKERPVEHILLAAMTVCRMYC